MKKFICFFILFLFGTIEIFSQLAIDPNYTEATLVTQSPTYATIAEAKQVLVVYNGNNTLSDSLKIIMSKKEIFRPITHTVCFFQIQHSITML